MSKSTEMFSYFVFNSFTSEFLYFVALANLFKTFLDFFL
ncbi:hypothetical protein T08_2216 [Trichinella sp. T8]|nr:hypothetical protein T08_2216 [Trichinella sp. T8]